MGIKRFIVMFTALLLCGPVAAEDIVVGIELLPVRKIAVLFTPIVLPDIISAKAAFEYRLHPKFNLVIPVEVKWMNYRELIRFGARLFKAKNQNVPESWYGENVSPRIAWNIDISQLKVSTGLGAKWFPFSESMTNAFFLKSTMMVGVEVFNAYGAEGRKDDAVFTHVFTIGYNWVKRSGFTFGFELGEEYTWHTSPIKELPILLDGLMPILQLSLGFTI
ncbi:MAG TPA: hypothetical protein VEL47_02095 [Myxococcota bacterium]|nr:hypothetical protein [Myxococcota bacterium]